MIGKTVFHYKIFRKLGEGDIRLNMKKKAGKAKPLNITRNSSTSGRTLTRG